MPAEPQPIWHPLEDLPLIAAAIRQTLDDAREQYDTLLPCHALDDRLIRRLLALYGQDKQDLQLHREQLARWKRGKLTAPLRKAIDALAGDLAQAAAMIDAVLALTRELGTRR
jgi:hypothetical protein